MNTDKTEIRNSIGPAGEQASDVMLKRQQLRRAYVSIGLGLLSMATMAVSFFINPLIAMFLVSPACALIWCIGLYQGCRSRHRLGVVGIVLNLPPLILAACLFINLSLSPFRLIPSG
ncbi:hypothetical protein HZU77_013790 [Neisseriaceae bacterium TC5R-5]|nr:hypothetical protein [Neisseriaceae bacterium TC5R-5]